MKKLFTLTLFSLAFSTAFCQVIANSDIHRNGMKMTTTLSLGSLEAVSDIKPSLTNSAMRSGKLLDCISGNDRLTARQLDLKDGDSSFGYKAVLVLGSRKEGEKPSAYNFENWPSLFFKQSFAFNPKGDAVFTWSNDGGIFEVSCIHSRED